MSLVRISRLIDDDQLNDLVSSYHRDGRHSDTYWAVVTAVAEQTGLSPNEVSRFTRSFAVKQAGT